MSIKYADVITKEIEERGKIDIPKNCVTGEDFEEWLRESKTKEVEEWIIYFYS